MTVVTLLLGFVFGLLLQYAKLNKYDVITGLAIRENYAVAKAILLAIGLGAIVLNVEIASGLAVYHVKPFVAGGLVIGGLLFGSGMAVLGYCPGTLAVSAGEGALDAVVGILGGLTGGAVFTASFASLKTLLGPDLSKISLNSLVGTGTLFFVLVGAVGSVFIILAILLHKADRNKDNRWIFSGIGLALLNAVVFSSFVSGRPIGASTTYPYLAGIMLHQTGSEYFTKIKVPGQWELIFLAGAFISGIAGSLSRGEFGFVLIHKNWQRFKGIGRIKRIVWAFVGGFILIFGARMAGGCTSGHILSGGMQLALSSLTFALFVAIGLLATGKVFYQARRQV